MANIYLDTNWLFDILERNIAKRNQLRSHDVFLSPLSYHIYSYITKKKIPNNFLSNSLRDLIFVSFSLKILTHALSGPTKDLEDNIQLHSAAEANCDYFLTNDKLLLKMGYFGKMQIVNSL